MEPLVSGRHDGRQRGRLLMLGLDAADGQLLRQWASEGHLPTLARLFSEGRVAKIATPPAVLEGAVWPTLVSGTGPGVHGMFAYAQVDPKTYQLQLGLRADRLPAVPFWVELSRAGKRVAVVDVPLTRPHTGLNGIQVTNWGAHDGWSWERASWPPRLMRELVRRFGDHPVPTCDAKARTLADYRDLRERLLAGVERKTCLLRYCLGLGAWDFFFGVYSESHCVGHQCWHLMDPAHPRHEPLANAELKTAIRDVYVAIDRGLAELMADLPRGGSVLVVLSHGMGPYFTGTHLLDSMLDRLGVNAGLRGSVNGGSGPDSSLDHSGVFPLRRGVWSARRLVPTRARSALKAWLPRRPLEMAWRWSHPELPPWRSLRVFSVPSSEMTGAIRINLKGRDRHGLVEPGSEYEGLCRAVTDELLALENVDTGRPAVQWVARAADLYPGPRLHLLPDLFVEWDHSAPIRCVRSPRLGTLSVDRPVERTGSHVPGGTLLGLGPTFGSGETPELVRTMDIAPTVLDFLGVARPRRYEGASVLTLLRASGERRVMEVGA
jgi:predicted AlkP superfamily phosphohydrolase/phosphomutase